MNCTSGCARWFRVLDDHTGVTEELGPLWPEQHRVASADDPCGVTNDDGITWFVRSPWPSISLEDIFLEILWTGVQRPPFDESMWAPRLAELFAWTESQARDWMNNQP